MYMLQYTERLSVVHCRKVSNRWQIKAIHAAAHVDAFCLGTAEHTLEPVQCRYMKQYLTFLVSEIDDHDAEHSQGKLWLQR